MVAIVKGQQKKIFKIIDLQWGKKIIIKESLGSEKTKTGSI